MSAYPLIKDMPATTLGKLSCLLLSYVIGFIAHIVQDVRACDHAHVGKHVSVWFFSVGGHQ